MEQTKLIRPNLGQVTVQFQPFDYRSGHLRIAKSVSVPFSRVDRRQLRMRSSQMQQSSSVVCQNARCSAVTSEQTKTVTRKAPTITGIPGKEKAAKLDDGGFGFPPYHYGGGGGGGDSSSGGWILFAVLGVLGFLKDKEIEWRNQKDK